MPPSLPPRVERLEDRVTPTSYPQGTLFVSTLADVVDGDTSSVDALYANQGADGAISLTEAMRAAESAPDRNLILLPISPAGSEIVFDGSTLDPRSLPADPDSAGPSQYVVTTEIALGVYYPFPSTGGPAPGPAIVRGTDVPPFRLFHVRPGGSLDLTNVELRGGLALGGDGGGGGGGAAGLGGAILNQGELSIFGSTLTGNTARGGAGSARDVESFAGGGGGGLGASADGFDGGGPNGGEGTGEGTGDPGGFGGGGGGGTSGGDGGFGGGGGAGNPIFGKAGVGGFGAGSGAGVSSGSGGPVTTPGGFGGADGVGPFGGGGAGMGGAIFNLGGTVRIANSTVFGNRAAGGLSGDSESTGMGLGGGVFNLEGTVTVGSSTFAANQADDGGAIYNLAATGVGEDAVLTVRNSVLVDSQDAAAEVVNRRLVNDGANAVLAATDPSLTNGGGFINDGGDADLSGVLTATRPVVAAALADNGGPTRTLLPTADSEAIDAGTAAPDGGDFTLTSDQRGLPRVSGASSDLGAVEVQIIPPPEEPPTVPLDTVAFTSPDGVTVRNARPGAAGQSDPFPGFAGDTRVAVADLDGDGFDDYVYAPGAGGGPQIRIIDGRTGEQRLSFFGFAPDFRGGVFLAVADVNGDTFPDVVASAGDGGGPHIRVFDGRTGAELASFFADDPAGRGGVSVGAGDVTGDGVADIVVGAGVNGDGKVKVIDGTKLNQLDANGRILPAAVAVEFQPYGGAFAPGLAVAVGRFDADRFADVAAGPLWRAAPQVFVRSGPGLAEVSTFSPSVGGGLDTGLRMVAADQTGDGLDELVVTAGPGGGPHTEVIDPLTGRVLESYFTFDPASRTGFGVG